MEVGGSRIEARGSLGSQWKSVEVHGENIWKLMAVDGSLWKLLEFSELVEVYEIYGSSWQ